MPEGIRNPLIAHGGRLYNIMGPVNGLFLMDFYDDWVCLDRLVLWKCGTLPQESSVTSLYLLKFSSNKWILVCRIPFRVWFGSINILIQGSLDSVFAEL